MRTARGLLAIVALLFVSGCEKQVDNPDVETFIYQLLSGTYNSYELPEFQSSDIPALLKYRNDTTIIKDFPVNGLSSMWMRECRLGVYALWTIESIRLIETGSDNLFGRFPSLNPVLALRSSEALDLVWDKTSLKEAASAYYNWWHSIHLFRDKMKIDPLKDTDYRWH